jgi:hypothetical protein
MTTADRRFKWSAFELKRLHKTGDLGSQFVITKMVSSVVYPGPMLSGYTNHASIVNHCPIRSYRILRVYQVAVPAEPQEHLHACSVISREYLPVFPCNVARFVENKHPCGLSTTRLLCR